MRRRSTLLLLVTLGALSCSGPRVGEVIPSRATVAVGKSLQLRVLTRDAGDVRWKVHGYGNGFVSGGGEYHAPFFAPNPPVAIIEAVAGASPAARMTSEITLVGSPDFEDCLAPGQAWGGPDQPYVAEPAVPLVKVPPIYPELAREAGVDGTVVVRVIVCHTGLVADAQVIQSVSLLDEAAMIAVRQWVFRPASDGSMPIASWSDIPVKFTLH